MCLYIFVGSFSVGLRLAKTTELRTTLCNARFLARCLRYAAFCIARFLARCLFPDLSLLRSGLPAESTTNSAEC